jgi:hypothetical protein
MRKRRDKVPEEAGDEEVFDFTGVDGGESDENIMKGKGKEKEKTDDEEFEPKSATARKRRRFADDLTFLDAGSQQQPVVTGVSLLPTPSSVLTLPS